MRRPVRPVLLPAGEAPGATGRPLARGAGAPRVVFALADDPGLVPLVPADLPDGVGLADLEREALGWLARHPPRLEIVDVAPPRALPIPVAMVQGEGAADHVLDAALLRRLQAGMCGSDPLVVAIPSRNLLLASALRHAVDGRLAALARTWFAQPRGAPLSPTMWLVDGGVVRGRVDVDLGDTDGE